MMIGDLIHTFSEGNRKAYVFCNGRQSFRVFMYDGYTDTETEAYVINEEEAEVLAEDWVLMK